MKVNRDKPGPFFSSLLQNGPFDRESVWFSWIDRQGSFLIRNRPAGTLSDHDYRASKKRAHAITRQVNSLCYLDLLNSLSSLSSRQRIRCPCTEKNESRTWRSGKSWIARTRPSPTNPSYQSRGMVRDALNYLGREGRGGAGVILTMVTSVSVQS